MPRIINTFASENPLAKIIGSLGNSMYGDQLTPAVNRQKLADAQREALGTEELARTFGAASDGNVNFNRAAESGVLAGLKPDDVAMFTNYLAGNITGPRSPQTTNAMAGAGKFADSAENLDLNRSNAFNMNAADNVTSASNNKYSTDVQANTSLTNNTADNTQLWNQFLQKPIEASVNGQPAFVQQGQATTTPNAAPILNDNQIAPIDQFRRQLQASELMFPGDPAKARSHAVAQLSKTNSKGIVISPDGTVSIGGEGGPMDLTNANQTLVQGNEIAYRKFKGTLGLATDLVKSNPNSVGLVGQARGAAQDLGTMAQGAAQVFGIKDIGGELANAQKEAAQYGVNLDFEYDPSVSQIESVMNILAFQGARAIGGQSGNDLSDKDLKAIKIILGDPTSLFTNQPKLLSRLALVDQYIDSQRKINSEIMGKAAPAAPGATSAETPTASAPAQKVIGGKTYTQQNGQWFEVTP